MFKSYGDHHNDSESFHKECPSENHFLVKSTLISAETLMALQKWQQQKIGKKLPIEDYCIKNCICNCDIIEHILTTWCPTVHLMQILHYCCA